MTHRFTSADVARWRELGRMIEAAIDKPPGDPPTSKLLRALKKAHAWPFPTDDKARWPQLYALIKTAQAACLTPPYRLDILFPLLEAVRDVIMPSPPGEPWWNA